MKLFQKLIKVLKKFGISADKIDIDGKAVHFKTNISKTVGPFTQADYNKVRDYLMGETTLTGEEFEKYDINGDGEIDSLDISYITQAIRNGGNLMFTGTFEINPYSENRSIALYSNRSNNYQAIISLLYNYFKHLYTGGIDVNGQITVEDNYGRMLTTNNNDEFELYVEGNVRATNNITCANLTQTSKESVKKNIEEYKENALEIVNNSKIYDYNFKFEKDIDKKHKGFVIGDLGGNYATPEQVISKNGQGIDTYTMTSILWKAVQELNEKVEKLEEIIRKEDTNA